MSQTIYTNPRSAAWKIIVEGGLIISSILPEQFPVGSRADVKHLKAVGFKAHKATAYDNDRIVGRMYRK